MQGRFVKPDLTFDEMVEIGQKGLDNNPMPKMQNGFSKTLSNATQRFETLEKLSS